MKGKYSVILYDNKVRYELELERNITVIKGKSGSGKSSLYNMFYNLVKNKRDVGIHCNCKDKIVILDESTNWRELISTSSNKIFVADEFFENITTLEFGKLTKNSDNYFIIISISGRMKWMTYSVNSIYELGTEKLGNISVTRLYRKYIDNNNIISPDLVITEDSNSGNEMMKIVFDCEVKTARGRDNVYNEIMKNKDKYNCIFVLVDGAAFGSCVGRIFPRLSCSNVYLFAPESFEFLLLLADSFSKFVKNELTETYNYCDSSKYVSWESFYTKLLCDLSKEKYNVDYTKTKLNKFFKSDYFLIHIKKQLKDIDWGSYENSKEC